MGFRANGAFCDGFTRRDFLKVGGLAMGGLGLADLLRAEAAAGVNRSHKAIIMVFLAGGPPHLDMFDLKPDAPAEIRGEFQPISTNLPGLDICEHMPRLAGMMDKFTVIRSMIGAGGDHSAGQCLTGYKDLISKAQGGRPSIGSVISKLQGPVSSDVPPFVGLSPRTGEVRWGNPGDPGFLGLPHAPFTPFRSDGKKLGAEVVLAADRMKGRRSLLQEMDEWRRTAASDEAVKGMDTFSERAFDILTSGRVFDALDVTREDPRLRDKYGVGDMKNEADGPPCCMDHFLMARRLVEAGVRCVTISFGRWDTHGQNFKSNAERIPKLDKALSALVEDLHVRGLDKDVSVVVWGEFGRTPKINKDAGRDHWPQASFTLMAGGGMKHGQVIGSTDKYAEHPKERPITYQSVFASVYRAMGIDPGCQIADRGNRPMFLLDEHPEPIRELF
ncbi:MAG: DUF1501 domain-containing protein [Isosphaeraceae bacterium]